MRPNARDVVAQLRDAAGVAGRGYFGHEADRRERRVRREALLDDGLERVELGRPRRRPPRRRRIEIARQRAGGDPVVNDGAAHAEAAGQWRSWKAALPGDAGVRRGYPIRTRASPLEPEEGRIWRVAWSRAHPALSAQVAETRSPVCNSRR
jgi:hypothetical protein